LKPVSIVTVKAQMTTNVLTIPYPEELLLSLKESSAEFEAGARLLLAVKLYEQGRVSTGMAARLAGMGRVAFMFALNRFALSPIGVEPSELADDMGNA
jgi:hypothetical protein